MERPSFSVCVSVSAECYAEISGAAFFEEHNPDVNARIKKIERSMKYNMDEQKIP